MSTRTDLDANLNKAGALVSGQVSLEEFRDARRAMARAYLRVEGATKEELREVLDALGLRTE